MSTEDTKECPYCAETIKKNAVVCRFCQSDLSTGQTIKKGREAKEVKARSGVEDGVKLGCGMFIVLPLLIIGGLFLLIVVLAGLGG